MATIYIPIEVSDADLHKFLAYGNLALPGASPVPTQPAAAPGMVRTESEFGYQVSQAPQDPWASPATTAAPTAVAQPVSTPTASAAPSTPQGGSPTCAHGQMRYVPAGFSKSNGQPYQAFWGCAAPRGTTPKCKSMPAHQ